MSRNESLAAKFCFCVAGVLVVAYWILVVHPTDAKIARLLGCAGDTPTAEVIRRCAE